MQDLADGEQASVKGSGSSVYTLKNSGGVYSCSCPAWRNQSIAIERRTCKHLRAFRGDAAEQQRLGSAELSGRPAKQSSSSASGASGAGAEAESDEGPPLLLAHRWESTIDITGWWLSEKLDGVRAYWDGTQFMSRLGNKFHAPPWFTEGLPRTPLDGELWGGRKLFQRTVGIVKRQDQSPLWKDLLYVVFDAPAFDGAFEERMAHCETLVGSGALTYVRVHDHQPCRGIEHLKEELARVEALGGEGLMARRPKSRYEVGRSDSLLKVKTFHDAEARVVGHVAGAGRHKGRVGALVVELADGTQFNVGTGFSDREREQPPEIGSLITFRYQELSDGGVPRFPSFVAVRDDVRAASTLASIVQDAAKPARAVPVAVAVAAPAAPVKAPAPAPVAPTASDDASERYFELVEGTASKFWVISLTGNSVVTRYGRIGSAGQSTLKEFASPAEAKRGYDKLVAEKTKKGYAEKPAPSESASG